MDKDYILLISAVLILFLVNIFLSRVVSMDLFPIFQPDFCYDSFAPKTCLGLWSFIEISGICIIIYYVIGKKGHERVLG